jgi:alpha-L-rhamnosidase
VSCLLCLILHRSCRYVESPLSRIRIGDLRLQALANYKTFQDTLLAKRCLYLFAGTPFHEDGRLAATVYEHPQVTSGGQSIVDFTLIYAAALLDYVEFSGDKDTGKDLFSVALRQAEIAVGRTNSEWVYHVENIGGMTDFGAWHCKCYPIL